MVTREQQTTTRPVKLYDRQLISSVLWAHSQNFPGQIMRDFVTLIRSGWRGSGRLVIQAKISSVNSTAPLELRAIGIALGAFGSVIFRLSPQLAFHFMAVLGQWAGNVIEPKFVAKWNPQARRKAKANASEAEIQAAKSGWQMRSLSRKGKCRKH